MTGTFVARRIIPGVLIQVTGSDAAKTLGIAELAFQRMMIGYVDRMGGWRGLAWMSTAFSPVLLASLALSGTEAPTAVRLAVILAAALGAFASFHFSYPALLVSNPLDLIGTQPTRRVENWQARLLNIYRYKYTRPTLAALGALILGIIGNKLAALIPFP